MMEEDRKSMRRQLSLLQKEKESAYDRQRYARKKEQERQIPTAHSSEVRSSNAGKNKGALSKRKTTDFLPEIHPPVVTTSTYKRKKMDLLPGIDLAMVQNSTRELLLPSESSSKNNETSSSIDYVEKWSTWWVSKSSWWMSKEEMLFASQSKEEMLNLVDVKIILITTMHLFKILTVYTTKKASNAKEKMVAKD